MTFEIYIDDDRYSVLQLVFVDAGSEADAIRHADALLRGNRHYRSVELWADEEQRAVFAKAVSASGRLTLSQARFSKDGG